MIPFLRTSDAAFEREFQRIVLREDGGDDSGAIAESVRTILEAVATHGDEAVVEYTTLFDARANLSADQLEVPRAALAAAAAALDRSILGALERAAARIRAFHEAQRAHVADAVLEGGGVRARLVARPLARVGVYVPGGTAAYPSTVLMNIVPAKVAGVAEIVMVTPAKGGTIAPAVLAAAHLAGADRVFSIGGAQAIGALAFGTARIPAVDKIVGPGNAYVAEAKRQVYGRVAIDQIAGPSEVLIVADESADPRVVAADLLAQAEHDTRAAAVLVTDSAALAEAVRRELDVQLATLPRADLARAALESRGGIVVAKDQDEAIALANRYAPEHLGLAIAGAARAVDRITAAGAVFVGHHTPEALGDYNAGVNHVLPTSGTARFGSPLSVHDFVRRMSVLDVDEAALRELGPDAATLARAEGLEAHARAIEIRKRT